MSRSLTRLCLLLALAAPVAAQDVALRVGHVLSAPGAEPLGGEEGAVLLVREGLVAGLAHTLDVPEGVPVVALPGAWAVAGFVEPWAEPGGRGAPGEAAAAIQADVVAGARLDRRHPDWARLRAAGVTACCLTPGDGALVPGWGQVVSSAGAPLEGVEPVLRLVLGASALSSDRPPTSRLGAVALLREALTAAHGEGGAEHPLRPFARGQRPGLVRVEGPADLRAALELQGAFGLRLLVQLGPGFTTEDLAGLELGPASPTFLLGPWDLTTPRGELLLAQALAARGVELVFSGHPPLGPAGGARLSAALAVRHGLAPAKALAALTTAPAAALGIARRAGTLEVGRPGDVVVLDGPPLDPASRVLGVWIGGRRVVPAPSGREEAP